MRLLDRYVLRNFLEPFFICFFGFISIWLIFDLMDNLSDFTSAHASLKVVALFYFTQLPQIVMLSLPVGLLLAMLFALSSMSRRNEIISMLTAGVSVSRVMLPLISVGMLTTGLLLWLNYDRAPHAEAVRKTAMDQITRGRHQGEVEPVNGYLFRDRMNNRTWFIRRFRPDSMQFDGIHITQQDANGKIIKRWYAARAIYDPRTKSWTINRGIQIDYNEAGDIGHLDNFENDYRVIRDWTETPWRIGSAHEEAQNLTVPQLRSYLEYNSDFPAVQLAPFRTYGQYRLAVPFQCMVVIFIAGPLAIVFSRRGVIGGVATAILLYAGLLLSSYFLLALGKGFRLNPYIASWVPVGVFFSIGAVLLYFKGSNRELPKFAFRRVSVKPTPRRINPELAVQEVD